MGERARYSRGMRKRREETLARRHQSTGRHLSGSLNIEYERSATYGSKGATLIGSSIGALKKRAFISTRTNAVYKSSVSSTKALGTKLEEVHRWAQNQGTKGKL